MDISTLVSTRVYPLRLPEKKVMPSVVLLLVAEPDIAPHMRGPGDIFRARVQVDSWAMTRDGAAELGALCRRRLNGFLGTWLSAGSPQSSIDVKQIMYLDGVEMFEEDILGGLSRHSADYFVTYSSSDESILAFL